MTGRSKYMLATALGALALAPASPAEAASSLRAGAGRADITPPRTGYYLGGYTRADRVARGQHTRLFAKAIVLKKGGRKIALVAIDLFMVPSGMHKQAAELAGFTERDVLISATHTHSGPGGYANFQTYNTAAPSAETITDPSSYVELLDPRPADPQLYTFLTHQIARAIRRADHDLGPATAGWGHAKIHGLTVNRSLEAHLADHGVIRDRGAGHRSDDPRGSGHTVDPNVDVLRVDKVVPGKGRVPIGAWSNYANHGTVTKAVFEAYNGDHHASAHRVFEERVRRAGDVPLSQDVVNVFGNSNEGDMSAGLTHGGPAGSDEVGRREAKAMLRAWQRAGRGLSRRVALDHRWTRTCFCGQVVDDGNVATEAVPGLPFFTGSEEERGPLFDVTGVVFEDRRSPVDDDAQGHKIGFAVGTFPTAVPIMAIRIGEVVIASLPGEPTKEIGVRTRAAVKQATRSLGIRRVTIAGLANEFISYITTPEEYQRQHYEGGSTLYGKYQGHFLRDRLAELARALARGRKAPPPHQIDVEQGVFPDGPGYPRGAASGEITKQPRSLVPRLGQVAMSWSGGAAGADRPVGRPFVSAQRRRDGRWQTVDSDLGLAMLWRVDGEGAHTVRWEVPRSASRGRYRLVVTANRYRLASRRFTVGPSYRLRPHPVERSARLVGVRLAYPKAVENVDLTFRPRHASRGRVVLHVNGRPVRAKRRGGAFLIDATIGDRVVLEPGDGRDRWGNRNGTRLVIRPGSAAD